MTDKNGSTPHARWILAMAASALAFAGASIATAASKSGTPRGETRIIKIVKHGDEEHASGEHQDMMIADADCNGAKPQVDESDETKDENGKIHKSRVVICSRGHDAGPEALAALERARDKLAKADDLSERTRERALASLDREIARLKSGARE